MKSHDGALSAIPYRLNLGLANAAISAGCHFADLGGNNTVVRQELALAKRAERKVLHSLPIAASLPAWPQSFGGERARRLGGRDDALKLYVGGLPERPMLRFRISWSFPLND